MANLEADHLFALPVAIPIAVAFRLASFLATPPLHPAVTGAALFALTRAPDNIRAPILSNLRRYLSTTALSRSVSALTVLFGLGLLRQAHLYLTELAENNFQLRSQKARYDWPREIAVVTGAAGGIGGAMVTDLTNKGVKVIAVDIAPSMPETLRNKSRNAAGEIAYYQCDLTDREAVLSLAKKVSAEHGDPSILINNAGIAYTHTTMQTSEKALKQIFDINIIAHYWTIQAFMPAMLKNRKGHIVATASMASFVGGATIGPYSATKASVVALHESLGQELRRIHKVPEILLTIAHPTFVRTAMTTSAVQELEKVTKLITPEEVSAGVMSNIFAGRGGQVILSGALGHIPVLMRGMPHWMSYALTRAGELSTAGIERRPQSETKMG